MFELLILLSLGVKDRPAPGQRTWVVRDGPKASYRVSLPTKWVPDHLSKRGDALGGGFHAERRQALVVGYSAVVSADSLAGILEPLSNRRGEQSMKSRRFKRLGWDGAAFEYRYDGDEVGDPSIALVVMVRAQAVRMCQAFAGVGHLPPTDSLIGICESIVPNPPVPSVPKKRSGA